MIAQFDDEVGKNTQTAVLNERQNYFFYSLMGDVSF